MWIKKDFWYKTKRQRLRERERGDSLLSGSLNYRFFSPPSPLKWHLIKISDSWDDVLIFPLPFQILLSPFWRPITSSIKQNDLQVFLFFFVIIARNYYYYYFRKFIMIGHLEYHTAPSYKELDPRFDPPTDQYRKKSLFSLSPS